MLLRLGTHKWHITLEVLYYYEDSKQLNLLGITTPLFTFVLRLWKPALYFKWRYPLWVLHFEKGYFWKGRVMTTKEEK